MRELAKQLGAMRGGQPDWYAVAEHLAETARPDLLKDPPLSRRVGRPKENWDGLYDDVRLVMQQKRYRGVLKACKDLSKGYLPRQINWRAPDGTVLKLRAAYGEWKGIKPRTLQQRYQDSLREWKALKRSLEGATK